jgi:hypothetical protein
MAWWQRLPTKESIAKLQVVSEMMAKAYEAEEARAVANLQAYGKTKQYKAFAKAEAIALAGTAATNEKAEDKRKSKSKAKAKVEPKPKAKSKAKVSDAQKIRKLKATVKALKSELASDDRVKKIRHT